MAVWIRDSFEFYKNFADTVTGSGFGMWDVQNLPRQFLRFYAVWLR